MQRLGDACVETRLIQDQIFALTGRRLLESFGSDTDQILALYDNALAASAELNLSEVIAEIRAACLNHVAGLASADEVQRAVQRGEAAIVSVQ